MTSTLERVPGERVVEARRAPWALVLALAAAALLLAPGLLAQSVDGVALDLGKDGVTNAKVKRAQLGVQWDWNKRWLEAGNWHVGGYWDLGAGYWDNDTSNRTSSGLWEIGFTPVFRAAADHAVRDCTVRRNRRRRASAVRDLSQSQA